MDRIWIQHYPEGVPVEIDPDVHGSLTELLDERIRTFAEHGAFTSFGTRISYAALDGQARSLAGYLQSELKLARGERIALMLPNLLQYPVAVCAALRAGLVVVNVNPLYTPRELKHQLNDAQAQTIVILADVLPVLMEIVAETGVRNIIVTEADDLLDSRGSVAAARPIPDNAVPFPRAMEEGGHLAFKPVRLAAGDLAFLQYTGGTTGLSKGAMLTHRNMVANTLQTLAAFGSDLRPGNEIFITALPLYHVFGLTVNLLTCFLAGGLNVLIANPRDLPAFVRELSGWRFTRMTGVNTLFNGLLNTPGFAELDFYALRTVIGGGMKVQKTVADRWNRVTGNIICEGYGLSETAPCLITNPGKLAEFTGSIGVPLPSTEVCIRDDSGRDLPPGQAGELCARGPQVMAGYWNRPEETRAAMTDDGFFRTGDIAVMDERGFFTIVDRKKDMINVSGFNVYPNEVEAVAASMDEILECACVGAPDPRTGEAVMLFVVLKPGRQIDARRISEWCRQRLAAYKVPAVIRFVESLPKSNVGKILRRELRAFV